LDSSIFNVRLQASASSLYSLHTRLLSGPSIGRIAPIGPAPTTAQLGNCLISTIPVIFLRLNTDIPPFLRDRLTPSGCLWKFLAQSFFIFPSIQCSIRVRPTNQHLINRATTSRNRSPLHNLDRKLDRWLIRKCRAHWTIRSWRRFELRYVENRMNIRRFWELKPVCDLPNFLQDLKRAKILVRQLVTCPCSNRGLDIGL
jgi:hypothetical protein